jgi:hypothetical protein
MFFSCWSVFCCGSVSHEPCMAAEPSIYNSRHLWTSFSASVLPKSSTTPSLSSCLPPAPALKKKSSSCYALLQHHHANGN